MDNIFWTGYSNNDRLTAITAITNIISRHADVVDSKLFSDVSLMLTIEVEESVIHHLYDELKTVLNMDSYEHAKTNSKKERTIYMNINFARATGDLIVETPNVPG
jgi:hypothetical protein